MTARKFLSSILPKGVLSPQEKEYEFMMPHSEKPKWREPVQSLLTSIKRGDWEIEIEAGGTAAFMSTCKRYSLSHFTLELSFSIARYESDRYLDTTVWFYGESWMNDAEKEAVFNAAKKFYDDLSNAFWDVSNNLREQEFMQLTKEN